MATRQSLKSGSLPDSPQKSRPERQKKIRSGIRPDSDKPASQKGRGKRPVRSDYLPERINALSEKANLTLFFFCFSSLANLSLS